MRYISAKRNPPLLLTLVNPGKPRRAKKATSGGTTMAKRRRRRAMRPNKKAAARKPTAAKVKRTAAKTAKSVASKTAKAVAEKAVKSVLKSAAKSPKRRGGKKLSRREARYASLSGHPAMPRTPPKRGGFVPWVGRPQRTKSISYTRTTIPGWRAVGGYKTKTGKPVPAQWRLFQNRRPKRRRVRRTRRYTMNRMPRRSPTTGRFLKRGFAANRRRRRVTRKHARRNVARKHVRRTRRRYHANKSKKFSLRKLFGLRKNTGVEGAVVGAAGTAMDLVKPGLAAAFGFFASRAAGNFVRLQVSSRSTAIRTMAPIAAHLGAALVAWYVPRKVKALDSLKPYSAPMAYGAMIGLAETLLTQFGSRFVAGHIAPPTGLGDSLDVYERALRGLGEGGWNEYNPSDDYLLATLADVDGLGEYIPEQLGEYIEEPMSGLGEYITEPGAEGGMIEASTGIDTGIYGPGVGDLGVEVEEAVAGVPIEAEEGLANHIFTSTSGNGLFGLGADTPTAGKIALKAKNLTIQGLKTGLQPTDAAKNAYANLKASEGVEIGSAAMRAAVVAGVREALQGCGVCTPKAPSIKRSMGMRPVAPLVTGPQKCREVCSTSPTIVPGRRLVGGAPMLTKPIATMSSLKDDLGDDLSGLGNLGGSMF